MVPSFLLLCVQQLGTATEGIAGWYHCFVRNQPHCKLTAYFETFTANRCIKAQSDVRVLSSPVMLSVCHCSNLLALGSPQCELGTRKQFPHLPGLGGPQLPICDGQDRVKQCNTAGGDTGKHRNWRIQNSSWHASGSMNVQNTKCGRAVSQRGKWSVLWVSDGITGLWFSLLCICSRKQEALDTELVRKSQTHQQRCGAKDHGLAAGLDNDWTRPP